MSADGSLTIAWGDGEYTFRTGLAEWRAIQTKCDAGLVAIMDRLQDRRWRVEDVAEPIRHGLIGGGRTPVEATALVMQWVYARPLQESVPVALAILMAAIVGVPDDPVGNGEAEVPGTDASASPTSTEPAPPAGSTPSASTE